MVVDKKDVDGSTQGKSSSRRKRKRASLEKMAHNDRKPQSSPASKGMSLYESLGALMVSKHPIRTDVLTLVNRKPPSRPTHLIRASYSKIYTSYSLQPNLLKMLCGLLAGFEFSCFQETSLDARIQSRPYYLRALYPRPAPAPSYAALICYAGVI